MTAGSEAYLASHSALPPTVAELGGDDAEALARVVRMAAGAATEADLRALAKAARAWMDNNGCVPWERCMGLPTTPNAFRVMQRDLWLATAAGHIPAASAWAAATQLTEAWESFLSRGPWREWRDDAAPPPDAAPLSVALFFASRFNRGESLGERHVNRIIRQTFEAKCR